MAGEIETTTDHDELRGWAKARGGRSASGEETGGGNHGGILRFNVRGGAEDSLEGS